jgi:DNA polymerase-1
MTKKRLIIIDFMAMAFRNFHAFSRNPLSTSSGFPTSSIFGSSQFLLKILNEESPDYIVAACDSPEATFRHKMYDQYKANRKEMPEDLSKQLPALFKMLESMNIKLYKTPGFEADDIIGTMCKQWANDDLEIYIVSGDKDLMQLVNENVLLYAPKKAGRIDKVKPEGVVDYFGVKPDQVIDVQSLIGDSVDNVPGVPGIGAKGAAKLINEFGSLDNIYENLDNVANKRQHTSLIENKEIAYLSKELVTLKTDMDISITLDELKVNPKESVANENLLSFFKEMEFRALITKTAKLLDSSGESSTASSKEEKSKEKPKAGAESEVKNEIKFDAKTAYGKRDYKLSNTKEKIEEVLSLIQNAEVVAFDTETTGLDIVNSYPIGVSFSIKSSEGYYIPLHDEHLEGVSKEEAISLVKTFFETSKAKKVAHNTKFDIQMLWNIGIDSVGPFEDTMLQAFVLNSSRMKFGIDSLCEEYLGLTKIPTTDLLGKKKDGKTMLDVELPVLSEYACEDVDCCFRLYEMFTPMIIHKKLTEVYNDIECPLIPVLAKMERRGIFVDSNDLKEISEKLGVIAERLKKEVHEIAGQEFNLNSTQQLREIIFEKLKIHDELGITRIKKTKSGFSTDQSVLEKLSEHRLPAAILEYRTVAKLKNTYVDALPELVNPKSGRIHTCFHQTGAATGRLSSSGPNLQNIPIRSTMGKEIRKAFKAEEGDHIIISADYSQIELRILAHVSSDQALIDAFKSGLDIHKATAATMFHKETDEVSSNDRSNAKAINYGIMYGMGPRRLSQTTGASMKEAKEFIEAYFSGFPNIKNYLQDTVEFAREHEYSKTITGRRRPINGLDDSNGMVKSAAENASKNSPIQGSAADLIKVAMVKLDKLLEESGLSCKMLLQVHDELVFECPKDEIDKVIPLIKSTMEEAMDLNVPIEVDIGSGHNWLEAH